MKSLQLAFVCRLLLFALGLSFVWPLPAQQEEIYKSRPPKHEENKQLARRTYEASLKQHAKDTNILVLPGLIADKQRHRVEVMVESTKLSQNASCEFVVVGEESEHAYESLMISFAKPSAIQQALKFIGKTPGQTADPQALQFWSKGECFVLSVRRGHEPPVRLERMFLDQRSNKSLPEEGFRFIGSVMAPSAKDSGQSVYAADVYQPMSIVSLFNLPVSVFEVPYLASQGDVYQNTVINPENQLTEEGLLTLVIEPFNQEKAKSVRELVLQVQPGTVPSTPLVGLQRVGGLRFQLKDGPVVMNAKPTINSVLEAIAALDRKKLDCFLTVSMADEVDLASAQALARLLAIIDNERGIRINPPPAGQLNYRAFIPDRDLLDRENRTYHPWELALSKNAGELTGRLLRVDSVWQSGASAPALETAESSVSSPKELQQKMEAETRQPGKASPPSRPPVLMVFAPSTLKHGQLMKFLEPVLPSHKIVYLFLDELMPPAPVKKNH